MLLTPELKAVNLNATQELCLPINFDLGPIHVHERFCIGVQSDGTQLIIYATHNGNDIFRQALANLCQDFSIGPVTFSICISDIQIDNGMPKFHLKLEGCVSLLGRHCITLLDQVISLGRITPQLAKALSAMNAPGLTIDKMTENTAFFYTYPAQQTSMATVSTVGVAVQQ